MDVVVEFYGGPRDGEVAALPDLPDQWLFPVALDVIATFNADETFPTVPSRVLLYELALDPEMRRPSVNDAGRYRYEFKGYR